MRTIRRWGLWLAALSIVASTFAPFVPPAAAVPSKPIDNEFIPPPNPEYVGDPSDSGGGHAIYIGGDDLKVLLLSSLRLLVAQQLHVDFRSIPSVLQIQVRLRRGGLDR